MALTYLYKNKNRTSVRDISNHLHVPFDTVCYVSKSYDEFSTNVKKALEEDSDMRIKQRQEVAKVQNWDGKISNMLNLISENMK